MKDKQGSKDNMTLFKDSLYEIQLKGSKEEKKEITKVTRQSEEKVTDGDSDIDCDKTDRKHDE